MCVDSLQMLGWECLYFHQTLKVIRSVYVEDFKLAGATQSLAKAWQLMCNASLKLYPSEPFQAYMGCGQLPMASKSTLCDWQWSMTRLKLRMHSSAMPNCPSNQSGTTCAAL